MRKKEIDNTRRNLIIATTAVAGAAGAGAAIPFAWSWWPSERAKAAGAPVEADISNISPGELALTSMPPVLRKRSATAGSASADPTASLSRFRTGPGSPFGAAKPTQVRTS